MIYKNLLLDRTKLAIAIKAIVFIKIEEYKELTPQQNGVSYFLKSKTNPQLSTIVVFYFKSGEATAIVQGKDKALGEQVVSELINVINQFPSLF